MIFRGGVCGLPYPGRLLAGVGLTPGVFGLALAPYVIHARLMGGFLPRRQFAANVRSPGFRDTFAPAAESAGGDAVLVEGIPTGIVAGLPVAGEAMQLSVRFNRF